MNMVQQAPSILYYEWANIECHFINQNIWRNTRLWDIILSMVNLCVWGAHWNESTITARSFLPLLPREHLCCAQCGKWFLFPSSQTYLCGCQKMYLYKVAIYTVFSFLFLSLTHCVYLHYIWQQNNMNSGQLVSISYPFFFWGNIIAHTYKHMSFIDFPNETNLLLNFDMHDNRIVFHFVHK